jgi:ATP-binding cassette subfamily B protein RtxB
MLIEQELENSTTDKIVSETASLLGCMVVIGTIFKDIEDPQAVNELAIPYLSLAPKKALKGLAKELGLKSKIRKLDCGAIDEKMLPVGFKTPNGEWAVLARLNDEKAMIQYPGKTTPNVIAIDQLRELWEGEILEISGSQRQSGETRIFDITWFIPEFLRYRMFTWEVLAASAFIEMLALISPLFFQVVMDKVLVNNALSTLDVLVTVLVVVSVLEVALKCLRQYVATHTATRIDARLGGKLFKRLIDLPIAYFKSRSIGVTVMRVTELDSIREFLTGAANTLIIDLTFTFIFLSVMYYYSPFLTLIVGLSIPFYFILSFVITPYLQRRIESLYRDGAINSSFLNETLSGVETVKALSLEPQLIHRWERQTRDFVVSNFKVQDLMQISENLVQLIQKVTMVLILWFGARKVIGLELSIGQLIAFNMMANHVSQPIVRLAELWRNYVQTRVSIDRLGDVLNTATERNEGQALVTDKLRGDIQLDNVTFRYAPDSPPILENLSLKIPAQSMVAFVGASGSGKSTITKLVQKLYVPEEGVVTLDGLDVSTLDAVSMRQRMSVVLQENYLFCLSVRDNIALTRPAAPLSDIVEAAKMAGAHDFILELSDGYDTVLAEGGSSLSGGQRQRMAIARALLNKPSVLIFDEATSALDDHSQEIMQNNMEQIRAGCTLILIAHRLSTVRSCDCIYVIDKGKIVEKGTHDQLLVAGGEYAHLWAMQSGTQRGEV